MKTRPADISYPEERKAHEALKLTSPDLMLYESRLCDLFGGFFRYSSHSLHFPRLSRLTAPPTEPDYLEDEQKLFLPLYEPGGEFLGVFVARGVELPHPESLLPVYKQAANLSLENLALYKQSLMDPDSGLYTSRHLFAALERELDNISAVLFPEAAMARDALTNPERAGQPGGQPMLFSIMVIRLNGFSRISEEHGFGLADKLMRSLGSALMQLVPAQAVACRQSDAEFAVFLPGFGHQATQEIGRELAAALKAVEARDSLSGVRTGISPSLGYAVCPRDLDGMERLESAEKARRLLRRARLAARVSAEFVAESAQGHSADAQSAKGPGAVMPFSSILREGGRIRSIDPLSRVRLSLGRVHGARPGQRFAIWGDVMPGENGGNGSAQRRYKGEAMLVELDEYSAVAEVIHSDDPYFPPAAGDRLTLISSLTEEPKDNASGLPTLPGTDRNAAPDQTTGFLSYAGFLPRWCKMRDEYDNFALVLSRFAPLDGALPGEGMSEAADQESEEEQTMPDSWNKLMRQAAAECAEALGPEVLAARYAMNSFIFFVPRPDLELLRHNLGVLHERLARVNLQSAFGVAPHPFLDFRKLDALDNVQKTLEYALLLPEPHVGILDSLTLNISADHLFSQGDFLSAIGEYKKALLCDADNILAWNSLGVTLVRLGRHSEARSCFEEALKRDGSDVTTLYNLGHLCQNTGETGEARSFYTRCLELDPDSVYSLYRMGQLEESTGSLDAARAYYEKALRLPGGEALTRRSLARLAVKSGKTEEAREELHEALLANPRDALALQLLSGLYLDDDEDPSVAVTLARQSIALRPDLKGGWLNFARALEAAGMEDEARKALFRAGEL